MPERNKLICLIYSRAGEVAYLRAPPVDEELVGEARREALGSARLEEPSLAREVQVPFLGLADTILVVMPVENMKGRSISLVRPAATMDV